MTAADVAATYGYAYNEGALIVATQDILEDYGTGYDIVVSYHATWSTIQNGITNKCSAYVSSTNGTSGHAVTCYGISLCQQQNMLFLGIQVPQVLLLHIIQQ